MITVTAHLAKRPTEIAVYSTLDNYVRVTFAGGPDTLELTLNVYQLRDLIEAINLELSLNRVLVESDHPQLGFGDPNS